MPPRPPLPRARRRRDVLLRLYIDSVRQKIERNAIVGENLLAEGLVRTLPNVAAHYGVIELRRVWRFAGVLKLMEEMR
jgi:hypothetical protein